MRINRNNYAALLVVSIATTSVQAAPMDSIKALLARMQNNAIGRHLMTKRAAALVGVTAAGVGLWWWLKNRSSEQTQLTTQGNNVTIPWGVAQFQNVNGFYYATKQGPRFDIFLVCEKNHKPASNQELRLLRLLVHGHDDQPSGPRMLPLIESIADKMNKGSDMSNALNSVFVETDCLLRKFLDFENQGAKATVVVIDKETKDISVATLGDIRTALLETERIKITPSLKVANLGEGEAARLEQSFKDYACSHTSREAQVKNAEDEMTKKKLLFGLPVTRIFGEFSAKGKIKDVIIASPVINSSEITNEQDYLVIATDGVWKHIDASELKAVMEAPLSADERAELAHNLKKDCAVNEIFSDGLQEDKICAARNIRDRALLNAIRESSSLPDVTAMVIDIRALHSK